MKLRDVAEGTFFILKPNERSNLRGSAIYMRASGIPNYPTSVAQIIHHPLDPSLCGGGAFPGLVALHTDIYSVELSKLKKVVSREVYIELQRALQAS